MPYITTPVIFVLISLIAVVPLCLVMLSVSVNYVHKAQNVFHPNVADFTAYDGDYTSSDKKSGTVSVEKPGGFSKVGELSCDSAGLNTPVYYGANRVNYRAGAGLKINASLPGTGGTVVVSANATGGFNALYNVKTGDVITFVTTWGIYKYKVNDLGLNLTDKGGKGERLFLTTAPDKSAFSALGDDVYTVSATLISGPKAEEVQSE